MDLALEPEHKAFRKHYDKDEGHHFEDGVGTVSGSVGIPILFSSFGIAAKEEPLHGHFTL
jgi:hypothetical protein